MPGFDPPANFFVNLCDIRPTRNAFLTGFGCHWVWLKEQKASRNSKVPGTELFFHVTYLFVLKWSFSYRGIGTETGLENRWRAQDCGGDKAGSAHGSAAPEDLGASSGHGVCAPALENCSGISPAFHAQSFSPLGLRDTFNQNENVLLCSANNANAVQTFHCLLLGISA